MWKDKKLPPIGNVQPENPFFLAPMAGITDAVFRRICTEMGAGMTYSEMVSAKGLYYKDKKTDGLLLCYPEEKNAALQIFGHEPDIMAFAAEKLDSRPNKILDINMGCPVPKVFKNGDGSAMMKKPEEIEAVVHAASSHTSKPVTVKIRIGINEEHINAVECALAAQEGGAAAVAVHGRTREQYYTGNADRKVIAAVREALTIPVIANGDVHDAESAEAMMEETGCDYVMVGRAVRGNPWIFRDLLNAWEGRPADPKPELEEKKNMMLRQFRDLYDLKGEYRAVREMRSISGWYLKGVPGSAALRGKINQITDPQELISTIQQIGEK